ncbi:MAG: FIVAR domain-containing protein, partial [Firmicutes bacterium]|nr:FIVAR domain-containing protein [Bacillota bacterium]
IPILIKDSNENVISRMYFGKDRRIFLVTGFDENDNPILEDALNTGLAKNSVYHIGFMINTKNNTQSIVIVHDNQTYTLKDKPLLMPADSVGALQVHQHYMFNNNGFIYLDDVRVEESAVHKMFLRLAVQNAQKVLADARVGTEIGFYPQTAVDAFQAEIDLANGVLDSSTSTQAQVDQAIIDLNLAEDNFKGSKNPASATVNIDSSKGHAIPEGLSGANVRNVDQAWNYTSPEFKEGAATINPGFLRYFSGAVAKSLNMRTGLYEMEWVEMFRSGKEYGGQLNSAKKTYVKGPQRLSDYYKKLLGPLGIKLVITINGFTDSPESAGAIAKFCKDNHIEVEMYQLCNEPYFFDLSTNKNKFHFNNG